MSHRNPLSEWVSVDRVDLTLAKLGVVASVLLLGMRLLAAQVFLVAIPLATGSACLLYLATRDDRRFAVGLPTLSGRVIDYLPAAVLVALAALVVAVRLAGGRTLGTHLLTGGVYALLFAQLLVTDDERLRPGVLLAEVVVVALVVRFTALHSTPGFVGVDVWTHVPVFVEGIARTGTLAPLAESKYLLAPLYHAYGAVATLAVGAGRAATYLTLGVVVPLSVLFVYGAGRLLLPARWALVATATYAAADQFVRWGLHLIPNSLGVVFFLACFYFVSRLFVGDRSAWPLVGLTAFSLGVVFTHQVSTAVLLSLLAVATAVAWVDGPRGGDRTARALAGVFLLDLVVTALAWANAPGGAGEPFLWRTLGVLRETVAEAAFLDLVSTGGGSVTGATTGPLAGAVLPFVELLGFTLLLAGAVLGGLVMFRSRRDTRLTATYVLAAAAMFVVVFGVSLFGVTALLPGRWKAFLYVPMALMLAVGLYHVTRHASTRTVLAVLVVFALAYPMSMAVAERATFDSPAFEDRNPRYSYTEAEIAAVRTVSDVRPAATTERLFTDHPYRTLFRRLGGYERAETVRLGPEGAVSPGQVVYRDYQTAGAAILHVTEGAGSWAGRVTEPAVCRASRDRVYANDEVAVCPRPPEARG